MHRLFAIVRGLVHDDSGQDLMEYGLLAALIAVVAIAAVTSVGGEVNVFWTKIAATV
jgi:pilus assembly protein Flp/PilA